MKTFAPRLQLYPLTKHTNSIRNSPLFSPLKILTPTNSTLKYPSSRIAAISRKTQEETKLQKSQDEESFPKGGYSIPEVSSKDIVMVGAVSLGFMVLFMGMDDGKALALGPEGPLVEEFWDNVRRYGLYALTVSTGALWALLEPIYELLKNPISAVLIILILGGGFYIMVQIISTMVGINEFSYDYAY